MRKILTFNLLSSRSLAFSAFVSLALPIAAHSQGMFAPAIRVNEDVVTRFELEQRTAFVEALRLPGEPSVIAREELINDRLKQQAIAEAGIEIPPEEVELGIEEFASRANLSTDEFVKALADAGISRETLRDFVEIQLAWREYVRARFLSRARPSRDEIDRALGQSGRGGGVRVLLSEVIIPITPQNFQQVDALAEEISRIDSFEAFASAATQFSAAPSRNNSGRLDWLPISNLPPALQPVILGLRPGEVTSPISLPEAVALFQMRDIQEISGGAPNYSAIDYAIYYIAGGRSSEALAQAARLKGQIDTCDDLYGIAKDQPAEVLERQSLPPNKIPKDVSLELSKLDPGEVSTALTRSNGQTLAFLMLCGRTTDLGEDATREDVARALTEQRLTAFAASYVEQLRADALIVEE